VYQKFTFINNAAFHTCNVVLTVAAV